MTDKLFGFDVAQQWNYENGFYLTSHMTRLSKMLAHYELYKSIIGLPGHIVECGVFKGASLIRFCTFREILENPYSRKIIGFDVFGQFPTHSRADADDKKFVRKFENLSGDGISVNELESVLQYKEFKNVELIEGDILETVPSYFLSHPELKIALLHIDVDVYHPSMTILNNFYNQLVVGGGGGF